MLRASAGANCCVGRKCNWQKPRHTPARTVTMTSFFHDAPGADYRTAWALNEHLTKVEPHCVRVCIIEFDIMALWRRRQLPHSLGAEQALPQGQVVRARARRQPRPQSGARRRHRRRARDPGALPAGGGQTVRP